MKYRYVSDYWNATSILIKETPKVFKEQHISYIGWNILKRSTQKERKKERKQTSKHCTCSCSFLFSALLSCTAFCVVVKLTQIDWYRKKNAKPSSTQKWKLNWSNPRPASGLAFYINYESLGKLSFQHLILILFPSSTQATVKGQKKEMLS